MMSRKRWIVVLPALLFLLTLFLGGVFLRDVVAASRDNLFSQITVFNQVLNLISNYYVEEVTPDSLIEGAITGMLDRLDPHSNYMNAERFSRMEERNRGSYSGIGVSFAIENGNLTVISALEGGPSYDLGIRPGDIITHIEGKSAFGIKEQEVFDKLRGPKGTKVRITLRRLGEEQPFEYEIVRDVIPIQSVPYAFMLTPDVGYIMMRNVSARTADELEEALQDLDSQGMKRLILDLRGNSGGYLNAAVDVADEFIGGGKKIVYTQGRVPGSTEDYFATDRGNHPEYPIVVLIDAGSASASEIVAGAIQDWDRGVVAGRTSFGKGLVQRQYPLENNGALLLTVARYYTPSGRLIQRAYKPGEREDYYSHAGEDSALPGEAEDSALPGGEIEVNELAPADSTERPIFQTLLQKRTVYGGGGITPDVRIDESYQASRLFAELSYNRKFFDFTKSQMAEKQVNWNGDFMGFLQNFRVSDDMLRKFETYLEADTSFTFVPDSFTVNQEEIRRGLKAEIGRYLWSEEERYRVLILEDPALKRALELLPDAEKMLTDSRRIEGSVGPRTVRR